MKMPELNRIPRNKTAWSGSLTRGRLWNYRRLPTSSSPSKPPLGKLQMSVPHTCCPEPQLRYWLSHRYWSSRPPSRVLSRNNPNPNAKLWLVWFQRTRTWLAEWMWEGR